MFAGLTQSDFACYEPRKWKSNVYNRERLEVRQKLLALGQSCAGHLLGPDGAPLFLEASVEHPAVWNHKQVDSQSIFFSRNEAARKQLDGFIDRQKPISSLLDDPTPGTTTRCQPIRTASKTSITTIRIMPPLSICRPILPPLTPPATPAVGLPFMPAMSVRQTRQVLPLATFLFIMGI